MQLSIEEVKKLDSNSYQIIDIRSEEEVAHGAIKGIGHGADYRARRHGLERR